MQKDHRRMCISYQQDERGCSYIKDIGNLNSYSKLKSEKQKFLP